MTVGRFAPSPSGPLHAGSLVAALASWLDARARGGAWLVRIEDLDTPRNAPGATEQILQCLQACGLVWDGAVTLQSQRLDLYQQALDQLRLSGHVYDCGCTRKEIADSRLNTQRSVRDTTTAQIYPGTCRHGMPPEKTVRAQRFKVPAIKVDFQDRWQGLQTQDLALECGDFVLKRADGIWAYQLAVVVDDAAQGVTHVVRGVDLINSTPRQIALQAALGLALPVYMHVPVVLAADGQKLSKQTGAAALDVDTPAKALIQLQTAWCALGFEPLPSAANASITHWLERATEQWRNRWIKQ